MSVGEVRQQRGLKYDVESEKVRDPDVPRRTVHIIDEEGTSIRKQSFSVMTLKYIHPLAAVDALCSYEQKILEDINASFVLLSDYAREAGVTFKPDTTYNYEPK
jgi:hypothetical protein